MQDIVIPFIASAAVSPMVMEANIESRFKIATDMLMGEYNKLRSLPYLAGVRFAAIPGMRLAW